MNDLLKGRGVNCCRYKKEKTKQNKTKEKKTKENKNKNKNKQTKTKPNKRSQRNYFAILLMSFNYITSYS